MKSLRTIVKNAYHYSWSIISSFLLNTKSPMRVIGITGTKGKTTTVALVEHIFKTAGYKTASLSTARICVDVVETPNMTGNTMPGRAFVKRWLMRAQRQKCDFAITEVTSQGVTQYRHLYIPWDDAVFLGIHPEHIESHGSFERYRDAKKEFFSYVAKDVYSRHPHFFVYAKDKESTHFIEAAGNHPVHQFQKEDIPSSWRIPESLEGENKIDAAAACAIARRWNIADESIQRAIETFPGVPGRMEVIITTPIRAVVDYAHTPESLEGLCQLLREKKAPSARLICVLGSAGGGRDIAKRPRMGEVASRYCDIVVLTNEDPFDEDPMNIIKDIKRGIPNAYKGNTHLILDRKEAIQYAVKTASNGDVVAFTGKGSESSIRLQRGIKQPWSESQVVREAINHYWSKKQL